MYQNLAVSYHHCSCFCSSHRGCCLVQEFENHGHDNLCLLSSRGAVGLTSLSIWADLVLAVAGRKWWKCCVRFGAQTSREHASFALIILEHSGCRIRDFSIRAHEKRDPTKMSEVPKSLMCEQFWTLLPQLSCQLPTAGRKVAHLIKAQTACQYYRRK